jgi:hypothetical protein
LMLPCGHKPITAELLLQHRERNYLFLYFVKYLPHWKIFKINVVNLKEFCMLCNVPFFVWSTILDTNYKYQSEVSVEHGQFTC